jgi:hypothetical protein
VSNKKNQQDSADAANPEQEIACRFWGFDFLLVHHEGLHEGMGRTKDEGARRLVTAVKDLRSALNPAEKSQLGGRMPFV